MYRGDYDHRGDRNRKRHYDHGSNEYPGSHDHPDSHVGGYKRARHHHHHDDRGYHRGSRPGGGGYRDRERDRDRRDRYGPSHGQGESDHARAWRLAKKGLVEVGDDVTEQDATSLREHLQDTANAIATEMGADESRHETAQTRLLGCVGRLPHKTSVYAVLTALVNEKHSQFASKVLHATIASIQKDLDFLHSDRAVELVEQGDADLIRKEGNLGAIGLRVKLLLRFLGELVLVRLARAEDVLGVLDTLQSVCTPDDFTMESDEPLRTRQNAAAFKDFFASVVLDTLVYCGQSLMISCEDLYESLLSRCKEYVSNREEESNPSGLELDHPTSWLIRRLRLHLLWEPENDEELHAFCKRIDPLVLKWQAVNEIREQPLPSDPHSARWKIPGTVYPQALFADAFRNSEPIPLTSSLSIDSTTFDPAKAPPYRSQFRILDEDAGAAGAAIAKLPISSYLVVRSYLEDIIEAFHPRPSVGAKHLLSLCKLISGRFGLSQDVPNQPSAKSEYLLIEALFVLMLTDYECPKAAYYCSLLYHLVKSDPRSISPAVAIMVELLFREVPQMNAGATDAFVQVFSHFLSNFEYKWPWSHWTHVLEAQEDDPQRLFVSAVIERCVRLSYLQHMQSVLPSEFHMLLPPAPVPMIKYKGEDAPADEERTAVTSATREFHDAATAKIKAHPPSSALQAWLEEELQSAELERPIALEVFWTVILEAGAATFTHIRLLMEKYRELVARDGPFGGAENQLVLVKTVGAVWLKSPQHIGLILNMMLRQGTIEPQTIVNWVFTSDAVQQYSWPYVWGIINETLAYTRDTIATKKKSLEKATSSSSNGDDVEMDVGGLEDSLKRSEDEFKQLLITLFEGFNRVVTEHKTNCDAEGVTYKDNWLQSALAQMKALGTRFRVALNDVTDDLHMKVFNSSAADHDAKKVFHVVCDSFQSG